MYFVYALYNKKHDKIYIGQTINLEQRLDLHNDKRFKNSYTAKIDGQWELIYKESCESRELALKRERELKSFRGRQFVKKFIPAWRSGSARDC